MKYLRVPLLLALVAFPALAGTAAADPGPGDLLVTPTRLVFEKNERNAEVTLVNLGDRPATYRIGFVELRMDEMGGTREIERADAVPGELFAADLIRFSPRQVTLEPKVAQTVRLQVRRPADLPSGEYRSHLLFRAVPEGAFVADPAPSAALEIQLRPVYGISIPVIVRQGDTAAIARLSGLALEAAPGGGDPALRFRLERGGAGSLYGNLIATFEPAASRKGAAKVVLGQVAGVAVYSPNSARSGALALKIPPAIRQQEGRIRLSYLTPGHQLLAQAELAIQ